MDAAARFARIEDLFHAAVAEPAPLRAAWLRAHEDDAGIVEAVEKLLLRSDGEATELRAVLDAAVAARPRLPARIGPYEIVDELGAGGMGTVLLAERLLGETRQRVALKLIRGIPTRASRERLARERALLAELNHAHIARLIDAGESADGTPYLAMEYVDGVALATASETLGLAARLRLFVPVCRAVQHAHQHLIVHRDIKPGNILVRADGNAVLLDFGIAKLVDPGDTEATATQVFTPAYAAPEQRSGGRVTTAADVYGLGCVLFELVTGRAMREFGDAAAAPRPSVAAPAQARALRGDIDIIVGKAMYPDPEQRYATAGELADDIERYLAGHPVRAHAPSGAYRLRKFVDRHRGGVIVTIALVVATLAALALAVQQGGVARREAQHAQDKARIAAAVQTLLTDIFRTNSSEQSDPQKARQTTARELLRIGTQRVEADLADAPDARSQVLLVLGEMHDDLGLAVESADLYRKALEAAQAAYGADALETVDARLRLANALHSANSDEDAGKVLAQAQAILDSHPGGAVLLRAQLANQQAQFFTQRDPARALGYAHDAVAAYETLPPSAEFADVLSKLARAEQVAGNNPAAERAYERAVEVSRQGEGDPNPNLPRYYAELSSIQTITLHIAGAEQNARRALGVARRLHGENHIDVVHCEMYLGLLLVDTGRFAEGLALMDSAKHKVLALVGADDGFHTPVVLFNRARALLNDGRLDEALVDIDDAVANRRQHRPGTIALAQLIEVQATVRIELGRFADAAAAIEEARAIREKAGQRAPSAPMDSNLGPQIRLDLARHDAAHAATQAAQLSPPGDVLSTTAIYNGLLRAEVTLAAGDAAAAAGAAVALRARIDGAGLSTYFALQVARTRFIEGEAALLRGDGTAALTSLQAALAERRARLDPASPRILEAELDVARALVLTGDIAAAREHAQAAQAILKAHPTLGSQYREAGQQVVQAVASRK